MVRMLLPAPTGFRQHRVTEIRSRMHAGVRSESQGLRLEFAADAELDPETLRQFECSRLHPQLTQVAKRVELSPLQGRSGSDL